MTDVLTIDDLITDKKHSTFFAEVVTGKTGGLSTGADISTSTNQVTGQVQKTMPAIVQTVEDAFAARVAGMAFTRVSTFTAGATLTDMRQTLLWEVSQGGDGHEYGWAGSFSPAGKVVSAGSTPETTGGVGAGAWVDRTSDTLRSEIGYIVKTVTAISELKSQSPSSGDIYRLQFSGRSGYFEYKVGDYTSEVVADPEEGVYVSIASDPSAASGAFVRILEDGVVTPEFYGAEVGFDAYVASQAAFDSPFNVVSNNDHIIGQPLIINISKSYSGDGSFNTQSRSVSALGLNSSGVNVYRLGFTQGVTSNYDTGGQVPAIYDVAACDDVTFYKPRIYDTDYFGVLADKGGNRWRFEFPSIKNTGRDGIDIRGGTGHAIINPMCMNTGDDAIVITNRGPVNSVSQNEKSIIIAPMVFNPGNKIGGSGIRLGGKNVQVIGGVISDTNRFGCVISSLDADASVRPDDIEIIGLSISGINTQGVPQSDAAAYCFRDVDRVKISGGHIKGAESAKSGVAYYFTSNFTNVLASDPRNQDILIESVDVENVDTIVSSIRYGFSKLKFIRGNWRNYTNSTILAQTNTYAIDLYKTQSVDCYDYTNNPIFTRSIGQSQVSRFICDDCTLYKNTISPISFGDASESDKIIKSRITGNKFNLSPAISFTPVNYSEYDGDRSAKLIAKGAVTFFSSSSQTVAQFTHGLSFAPDRKDITATPRSAVAFGITNVTSTFIELTLSAIPVSNVIIDISVSPRY